MNTEILKFDNSELDNTALASGSISKDELGRIREVVYAIDEKIANEVGAELFVHEFNEVALYEEILKIELKDHLWLGKIVGTRSLRVGLSHNLNAEGDGEYTQERDLLKSGYITSDRLPAIDHVYTKEETDAIRMKAKGKIVHYGRDD